VELPVDEAQKEEAIAHPAGNEQLLVLEPGQPECCVLVVEDEPDNSALLERLLSHAGFKVRVAPDGVRGVQACRELRPRFVWMDLRMPEMDGFEAVRQIRSLEGGREIMIAAVTASVFAAERSKVLNGASTISSASPTARKRSSIAWRSISA